MHCKFHDNRDSVGPQSDALWGLRYVPLYPAESKLSGDCRGTAAPHRAALRSTGEWERSGLVRETDIYICELQREKKTTIQKTGVTTSCPKISNLHEQPVPREKETHYKN